MTEPKIDFQQLKREVAIEDVLRHYGVELRGQGGELRGRCPLPTHTSLDSRHSFSVSPERNVWCCQSQSCMSARAGQIGGTVLDLVAQMEQCSIREAGIRLKDRFDQPALAAAAHITTSRSGTAAELNLPLKFELRGIDCAHPYLEARGIAPWAARSLGIGHYNGPGIMHGRIVIPIRNARSELVGYAGRSIDAEEPKYRLPPGFHKSQELYNLNRAQHSGSDLVIVVEGYFDAAKVVQAGHRNVVALMVSSMSDTQAMLIERHFGRVVLMLDGDPAGQHGTAAIAGKLASKLEVSIVDLPVGKQPDQMGSNEIRALVATHLSRSAGLER